MKNVKIYNKTVFIMMIGILISVKFFILLPIVSSTLMGMLVALYYPMINMRQKIIAESLVLLFNIDSIILSYNIVYPRYHSVMPDYIIYSAMVIYHGYAFYIQPMVFYYMLKRMKIYERLGVQK